MVLTVVLLIALLYAVWKWWSYFCTAIYLGDRISRNGIKNPIEQGVSNYINQNISWLLRKFLKS